MAEAEAADDVEPSSSNADGAGIQIPDVCVDFPDYVAEAEAADDEPSSCIADGAGNQISKHQKNDLMINRNRLKESVSRKRGQPISSIADVADTHTAKKQKPDTDKRKITGNRFKESGSKKCGEPCSSIAHGACTHTSKKHKIDTGKREIENTLKNLQKHTVHSNTLGTTAAISNWEVETCSAQKSSRVKMIKNRIISDSDESDDDSDVARHTESECTLAYTCHSTSAKAPVTREKWTDEEMQGLKLAFAKFLQGKQLPGWPDVIKARKKFPILSGRTKEKIKARFVHFKTTGR